MIINKIVSKEIINKFIDNSEVYILSSDSNINILDKVFLIYGKTRISGKIVNIRIYNSMDEILKVYDYKEFGYFESISKFISYYNKTATKNQLYVCKIKNNSTKEVLIDDKKILDLIDFNEVTEQNNIGFSSSKIIKVRLKNGKNAILKMNDKASKPSLEQEYMRMQWMQNKIRCPKIIMWRKNENKEYLLMECIEGQNSYMYKNIGYRLGEELKNIHNIKIDDCQFNEHNVENLIKQAKKQIDYALPELLLTYPNETKNTIIQFLICNKPKDEVFTHGDYSLPNIIINEKENQYYFIDLGQAGISTKYLDIYCAIKSFKMNDLENEISGFLNGYGIDKLDENYMKWMHIIDKILN